MYALHLFFSVFSVSVDTAMCGVIERGKRISYYCFCYLDYCNHGNRLHHTPWGLGVALVILMYFLCHIPLDFGLGDPGGGSHKRGQIPHNGPPAT